VAKRTELGLDFVRQRPWNPEVYYCLVPSLTEEGHHKEAVARPCALVALNPRSGAARAALASRSRGADQTGEAEAQLKKRSAFNPTNRSPYFTLGNCTALQNAGSRPPPRSRPQPNSTQGCRGPVPAAQCYGEVFQKT
jgi:predicted Zn-dependent protease